MQWETYRRIVQTDRLNEWPPEFQLESRRLGEAGWQLVSTSFILVHGSSFIEVLWYQRPRITSPEDRSPVQ